jgi:hypothetical protein
MGRHGSTPYPKELRDQAVRLVREWRKEHGRRDGGIREVATPSWASTTSNSRRCMGALVEHQPAPRAHRPCPTRRSTGPAEAGIHRFVCLGWLDWRRLR